jgi:hypothetical protein
MEAHQQQLPSSLRLPRELQQQQGAGAGTADAHLHASASTELDASDTDGQQGGQRWVHPSVAPSDYPTLHPTLRGKVRTYVSSAKTTTCATNECDGRRCNQRSLKMTFADVLPPPTIPRRRSSC